MSHSVHVRACVYVSVWAWEESELFFSQHIYDVGIAQRETFFGKKKQFLEGLLQDC